MSTYAPIEEIIAASGWHRPPGGRLWHRYHPAQAKSFCSKSFIEPGTPLLDRCPADPAQQCPRCRMERTRSPWRKPSGRPPAPRSPMNTHKNSNPVPGGPVDQLSEIELVQVICRSVQYLQIVDGLMVRTPYSNGYRRRCVQQLRARRLADQAQRRIELARNRDDKARERADQEADDGGD